jgi:hypothetical protein
MAGEIILIIFHISLAKVMVACYSSPPVEKHSEKRESGAV